MEKTQKIEEVLREAAAAVAAADVPEDLRAVAFKEAVDFLRDTESGSPQGGVDEAGAARSKTRKKASAQDPGTSGRAAPDEATFFSQLADESGVPEQDLRDILNLTADGKVQVTPPTRKLGSTAAEQAKTVIALVSCARAIGLSEKPVDAEAVRREVERKHCYQSNNFASKHLGPMKGFNAGSNKNEILLTSRWVEEFKGAVAKAQGQAPAKDVS